uniref:Dermonecrotic toxin LiSicTox-betaID1 n=1 Tax=Loxosceles intermedia TaxID=58218 RepID=B1Q_LOXIN|nr:RecName: Full=Dermonecrotic toxin LiSicTox-betaID1; AltName: Full=Dermonecrotic toxin 5; Short=DT5; AltName: Full=LiRecDT5; AltName: Full=Phospholipase D; Short=PLD; AltName: Full=Sphingomyelin phosphodiesterase D 5; Short=SMD 5; Short=SMase D 5; Short=Sphingomyelinase D 5; Flags: Precursor [Loxosceles intermedia]ABD91847.1 dermonecrotic toxin isoform 5 [Loxosceles intermedia]
MQLFIILCLAGSAVQLEGTELDGVERADNRRPIWNIAHMVNDKGLIDEYLDDGANSVESDVSFDSNGKPEKMLHGSPCDCGRSCKRQMSFADYLDYMRQLTTPGDPKFRENLILVMLDLKLKKLSSEQAYSAGQEVASQMLDKYWKRGESGARAYIVLSIPTITRVTFVNGFYDKLHSEGFDQYREKVGVDFSGNEDLEDTGKILKSRDILDHIWQSDGITNCLFRIMKRLKAAIRKRDSNGYMVKVYTWSVDKYTTMRKALRAGADGMITNFPKRLVSVLNEREFSGKFRLATYNDNPWERYTG